MSPDPISIRKKKKKNTGILLACEGGSHVTGITEADRKLC